MILTIGKFAILAALYAFVLVVFRGIIAQLVAESRRGQEAAASVRVRARRPSWAGAPPRAVTERPRPVLKPQPEPASQPPVEAEPPREAVRAAAPPEAVASEPVEPPSRPPTRIDLLGAAPEAAGPTAEPEEAAEPATAQPSGRPHLVVLESDDEERERGEAIALSAAVTIGRSEENSLQIADRFISSRHALLCLRDGRRILVDRGSTNGTFVNGQRIDGEVELSDGDRIALGNTVLEYHAG